MATLEVQAFAAADELTISQGANIVLKSRLVLALAWMQGYTAGLGDGQAISDEVLGNIHAELAK